MPAPPTPTARPPQQPNRADGAAGSHRGKLPAEADVCVQGGAADAQWQLPDVTDAAGASKRISKAAYRSAGTEFRLADRKGRGKRRFVTSRLAEAQRDLLRQFHAGHE